MTAPVASKAIAMTRLKLSAATRCARRASNHAAEIGAHYGTETRRRHRPNSKGRVSMRIWKLTPTDLADPIWKKWSPEPIIVRAESETEARDWAQLKTTKTGPAITGLPLSVNPWAGHKKIEDPGPLPTLCEDITEQTNEYSVDGPPEVLRHGEKF